VFERFTARARSVVLLAQEVAVELGSSRVEPAHIFVALVREGEGFAAGVLGGFGFVEAPAPRPSAGHAPELELSAAAAAVYSAAEREAMKLGNSVVGTEHLLLGLSTALRDEVVRQLTSDS
jgi:ATP-dependent Clp protease ATP-binding subunit ClpC